ncbi:MAG TPA: hypothetical protein VMA53_04425 [Stellaceae bacterium]|nr:hypothetical protein [Stellaceae bacterium]
MGDVEGSAAELDNVSGETIHRPHHPFLLHAHDAVKAVVVAELFECLPRRIESFATTVELAPRNFVERLEYPHLILIQRSNALVAAEPSCCSCPSAASCAVFRFRGIISSGFAVVARR